jgi:hypothetical protein
MCCQLDLLKNLPVDMSWNLKYGETVRRVRRYFRLSGGHARISSQTFNVIVEGVVDSTLEVKDP